MAHRKPRSNYETAEYWADQILELESRDSVTYKNMSVGNRFRGQTDVRHFNWYPLGCIIRDEETGEVRRVITNADQFPNKGFANTPGQQHNVDVLAAASVRELNSRRPARTRIRVEKLPLTDSHLGLGIRILPCASDPEPPQWSSIDIPTYFTASDPGPEPEDDGIGCIAGRVEDYTYAADDYAYGDLHLSAQDQAYVLQGFGVPLPGDFLLPGYARRMRTGRLEWVSGPTYGGLESERKRCPHCKAFAELHERWHVRMYGPRWGRGRGKGYRLFREMMDTHGSEEGWRTARREDHRRVQRERIERKEWEARNYLSLSQVSKDDDGLPILRDDKYAMRKDAERVHRAEREAKRQAWRATKERLAREREERAAQRWLQSLRRGRKPSFQANARVVAESLASMRERIEQIDADREHAPTNGLES